jgi:hypothetical protein
MFNITLKQHEDFDLAFRVEDGSDQFSGMSITCCLRPPTGSQINLSGDITAGGSLVSFRAIGSTTASWPTGLWAVEIWSDNGAGSRDEVTSGTMRVVPSAVTVP